MMPFDPGPSLSRNPLMTNLCCSALPNSNLFPGLEPTACVHMGCIGYLVSTGQSRPPPPCQRNLTWLNKLFFPYQEETSTMDPSAQLPLPF